MSIPCMYFDPLISGGILDFLNPYGGITECELNILWTLGKKGPLSIYGLAGTKYYLPEGISTRKSSETSREKIKKGITYHYPFIHKTVERLRQKNLVHTLEDSSGLRTRKMVNLTFAGLSVYLRKSTDKERFKHAIKHYPKLLPFSKEWDILKQHLSSKKVIDAFQQAIGDCICLREAKFRIRRLSIEFEGFHRNISVLDSYKHTFSDEENVRERNEESSEFLRSEGLSVLTNSYIAYLAIHDISKLSKKNKKQLEQLLPKLDSERELAYFEKREIDSDSLFKGSRLKEFFPKYADIRFFFTGMFVENLLWDKKTIEPKNETYDFYVEYLR